MTISTETTIFSPIGTQLTLQVVTKSTITISAMNAILIVVYGTVIV